MTLKATLLVGLYTRISMFPLSSPSQTPTPIDMWTQFSLRPTKKVNSKLFHVFHSLTDGTTGFYKAYIVLPSTIWGFADNAFTAKGLQKLNSVQVPWIISTSITRGTPLNIGAGLNLWPHISIEDSRLHSLYKSLKN